jgi:hypothetical protein
MALLQQSEIPAFTLVVLILSTKQNFFFCGLPSPLKMSNFAVNPVNQLLYTAISVALFVVFTVSATIFYLDARYFTKSRIMVVRNPILVICNVSGTVIAALALSVANAVGNRMNVSCMITASVFWAGITLSVFTLIARLGQILILNQITSHRLEFEKVIDPQVLNSKRKAKQMRKQDALVRKYQFQMRVVRPVVFISMAFLIVLCWGSFHVYLWKVLQIRDNSLNWFEFVFGNSFVLSKAFQIFIIPVMLILLAVAAIIFYYVVDEVVEKHHGSTFWSTIFHDDSLFLRIELLVGIAMSFFGPLSYAIVYLTQSPLFLGSIDMNAIVFLVLPAFVKVYFSFIRVIWIVRSQKLALQPTYRRHRNSRRFLNATTDGSAALLATSEMKEALIKEMESYLLQPFGYNLFLSFEASEWSVENLLFWKTVRHYRLNIPSFADPSITVTDEDFSSIQSVSSKNLAEDVELDKVEPSHDQQRISSSQRRFIAENIYWKHLEPKSPLRVRLSQRVSDDILQNIGTSNSIGHQSRLLKSQLSFESANEEKMVEISNVFMDAEQEVLLRMSADSFGRFRLYYPGLPKSHQELSVSRQQTSKSLKRSTAA